MSLILFPAAAVSTLTVALAVLVTENAMAVKPAGKASLKAVAVRIVAPAAARPGPPVAPKAAVMDNDGDRFRYDSCGCTGG